MKTPQELATQEAKEKEDFKKSFEERILRHVKENFERALKSGKITSAGGEIELPCWGGDDYKKGFEIAKEYFEQFEWEVVYEQRKEPWYSMTCKSWNTATTHYCILTPAKK